jgi:hypothetical protein
MPEEEEAKRATDGGATAWSRLKATYGGLLDPIDPRLPQPEPPKEYKDWVFNVSCVVSLCMVYTGWQENIRLQQDVTPPPRHLPPALYDMFKRNQTRDHVAKVGSRAMRAGWHAFLFSGLFFGLDNVIAVARGENHKAHMSASGAATGAIYGALLPGGVWFKFSRAGLGAAAGSLTGILVGWLQHDVLPQVEASR